MRRPDIPQLMAALCATIAVAAGAQQPPAGPPEPAPAAPARQGPPPDALDPAVNTSAAGPASAPAEKAAAPASAASPANPPRTKPAGGSGRAQDHLQLETSEITGNRELPKVLYIVPWKRSDLGDLVGKPVNSLLDEVLEPVDRDVFRRENRYYRALQSDSSEVATPAPPK